jgi:quercetin dioxygenase-like cupin family protein
MKPSNRPAPQQATRYLRLPLDFDQAALQADLQSLVREEWVDHYNDSAYSGGKDWQCQSLRSAGGRTDQILATSEQNFLDTPLLARCPYFQHVLQRFACETLAVRLMALGPGAKIHEHTDPGGGFEDGLARLHIPIVTHPAVLFWLDGEPVHFTAGGTWYMNANCRHRVDNPSAINRIHLVLDCLPNPWLRDLFDAAGFIANPAPKYGDPSITDANVLQVIEQLQHSGASAALALAHQLEMMHSGRACSRQIVVETDIK